MGTKRILRHLLVLFCAAALFCASATAVFADDSVAYSAGIANPLQASSAEVPRNAAPLLKYRAYLQNKGWMSNVTAGGKTAGSTRYGLDLEALRITVTPGTVSGSIRVQTRMQSTGWTGWEKSGKVAGSTVRGDAIEAMRIKLTGKLADKYDVYYCTFVENLGWLGWAKNGQAAGTIDHDYAVEAFKIMIVPKGDKKPDRLGDYSRACLKIPVAAYSVRIAGTGWLGNVDSPQAAGMTASEEGIDALRVRTLTSAYKGTVKYRSCVDGVWEDEKTMLGSVSGTPGAGKRIEAVQFWTTGSLKKHYDIYYCVYDAQFGWMNWAKNGKKAGTGDMSGNIKAIRVKFVPKGAPAPEALGDTQASFFTFEWPVQGQIMAKFGPRGYVGVATSSFHRGIDICNKPNTEIRAAAAGVVEQAGSHWSYGNYLIINHGGGYSTMYMHNNKLLVGVGDKVEEGQVISLMGMTGQATGEHCHFEVHVNGKAVDPLNYLP